MSSSVRDLCPSRELLLRKPSNTATESSIQRASQNITLTTVKIKYYQTMFWRLVQEVVCSGCIGSQMSPGTLLSFSDQLRHATYVLLNVDEDNQDP